MLYKSKKQTKFFSICVKYKKNIFQKPLMQIWAMFKYFFFDIFPTQDCFIELKKKCWTIHSKIQ